jgi:hypothetical protein
LHWELISIGYSFTPPSSALWQRAVSTQLGTKPIWTLGPEDSLIFGCIHAAKHGWSKLSFLVDITQLIRRHPNLDWEFIASNSVAHGAKGFVGISLHLAQSLLEADIPNEAVTNLYNEPRFQLVAKSAESSLFPRGNRPTTVAVWPPPWHELYFKAMCRTWDKAKFLHDVILRPTPLEWRLLKLPLALSPLYYAVRPLRLIWRQLGRLARRGNPLSGITC